MWTVFPLLYPSLEPPMQQVQSSSPPWHRGFASMAGSHPFEPLRVEGTAPTSLRGTLYRNGPGLNQRFGRQYDHWFDGDGAITAVRIAGGSAFGAARILETATFQEEERAGRRLYSGWSSRPPRPLREYLLGRRKNAANVNVVVYRGRLLALGASGVPLEFSREALSIQGRVSLGAAGMREMGPHPHRVATRKATYYFGQRVGPRCSLFVIEATDGGDEREVAHVPLDAPVLLHDFAVTERHAVFLVAPLTISPMHLLFRGTVSNSLRWSPQEGTEVIVIPLDTGKEVVRFKIEPIFLLHTANAFEDGTKIVLDAILSRDFLSCLRWFQSLPTGAVAGAMDGALCRMSLNPTERAMSVRVLQDAPCELPRVSPSVEGRRHRFVYSVAWSAGRTSADGMPDALTKHDVATGRSQVLSFLSDHFVCEPVFVPSGGAEEDHGYVLAHVLDARSGGTYVAVIDGQQWLAGAVARLHLPFHVPFGFHGTWVEERSEPPSLASPAPRDGFSLEPRTAAG
jgi:all-trans-8'-apo-beta-carotenal 15,15'-oxygenase